MDNPSHDASSSDTRASYNVAAHLDRMAELQAEALAIAVPRKRVQGQWQYTRLNYRELRELTDRSVHALRALGVQRGMRTVLMVPPGVEFFALTFALFKLGAVPVLVDPGMGVQNLGVCLGEAEPEAFIGIPKAHTARVLFRWARKSLRHHIMVGRSPLPLGQSFHKALRATPNTPVPAFAAPEHEVAAILFTSGSTGIPKGAVYSHGNFSAQVDLVRDTYGIQPGEVDLPTFPLFALFAPALGMSAVIPHMDFTRPGSVDPATIVDAVNRFGCTTMFGSPALIRRVGAWGAANHKPMHSLRRALSAGAPVPPRALQDFGSMLFRGVDHDGVDQLTQIYTPYGATEALPVASIGSEEILGETAARTAQGAGTCVGRPVAGVDVRIIAITDAPIADWNSVQELPAGQIGEVVVKGAQVTRCYFRRDESTALAKIYETSDRDTGPFWHRMGDCGSFDAEGRLWFVGRKSQRIRTSEGDFFADQCEGVLNGRDGALKTAVVGIGPAGFQTPVAIVEFPQPGQPVDERLRIKGRVSIEKLVAMAKERAKACPLTEGITTFLVHPSLPVDIRHNAKIGREALARWAARKLNLTSTGSI